ncbi:LLM class flavin-dependent oxidoreductase [Gordonia polyisoprenivorans]|uniref:LLM class flavin-dependent oxidoreductase n=1 Tax=Gordonia polyisoprenivorans TaxID=84595 RepID=UPI0030CCF206
MTKVLWYISPVDGRYPWAEDGRYPVDHSRLQRLAQTIDRRGYYGALLGTYAHDVWTTASTLLPPTQRLRFLLPVYPGVISPTYLAQQALTFEDHSGGRLLFNAVKGTESISRSFGLNISNDVRYAVSEEYWELFKKVYQGKPITEPGKCWDLTELAEGAPTEVDGVNGTEALGLGPIQLPHTPIWGAAASPAGIEHSARVLDEFLAFWDRPDKLAKLFGDVKKAAAAQGRQVKLGVHGSVIERETEEEAWAHAQWLLDQTTGPGLRAFADAALQGRQGVPGGVEDLSSDDPQVQFRIDTLKASRVPKARDLEIAPNLWSGVTPWSPLDPQGAGWGTFIVGDPKQVADRIHELEEEYSIDSLILSNWPLAEEAERFADLVLPLLDLDHDAPALSRPTANLPQEKGYGLRQPVSAAG